MFKLSLKSRVLEAGEMPSPVTLDDAVLSAPEAPSVILEGDDGVVVMFHGLKQEQVRNLCHHFQDPVVVSMASVDNMPSADERGLRCFKCGKKVSTPLPEGFIFRATAECPECTEASMDKALLPTALTAENGAKGRMMGEFHEPIRVPCDCGDDLPDPDCEHCNGDGYYIHKVPVSWTTIKAIWRMAVEHFGRRS